MVRSMKTSSKTDTAEVEVRGSTPADALIPPPMKKKPAARSTSVPRENEALTTNTAPLYFDEPAGSSAAAAESRAVADVDDTFGNATITLDTHEDSEADVLKDEPSGLDRTGQPIALQVAVRTDHRADRTITRFWRHDPYVLGRVVAVVVVVLLIAACVVVGLRVAL